MLNWIGVLLVLILGTVGTYFVGFTLGVLLGVSIAVLTGFIVWVFIRTTTGAIAGEGIMRYILIMLVLWSGIIIGGVLNRLL